MRIFLSIFGMFVLAGLWFGPLPDLARQAFFAHMTLHMGLVAVAAPILAFAVTGTMLDPVKRWPALFPPVPLSIVELIVVWAWHTPALHHAARNSTGGFVVEQAVFLLAGLLVWISSFGGDGGRDRKAAGVVALLLTSMHMTLLGALLALSPRPLYQHVGGVEILTPLDDQHLGGAVMLLIGGISYLAGGLWLTVDLVRVSISRGGEAA